MIGMTDLRLFIAAGLPTISVLIGILLSNRSADQLGKRIDSLDQRFNRVETRLDRIEADLREFYRTIGQHDARRKVSLDALEKRGA